MTTTVVVPRTLNVNLTNLITGIIYSHTSVFTIFELECNWTINTVNECHKTMERGASKIANEEVEKRCRNAVQLYIKRSFNTQAIL